MDAATEPTLLMFDATAFPCAHRCRYCSIGDHAPRVSAARCFALIERFADWAATLGPAELRVQSGFMPAFNMDAATFAALRRLNGEKLHMDSSWIPLGGLRIRDENASRDWLSELQAVGLEGVSAAFVGCDELHDKWNNRRGDFNFLMSLLKNATQLGLRYRADIFLIKSSLPKIDELISRLYTLGKPPTELEGRLFFYLGNALRHEDERLTERDRDSLPPHILSLTSGWGPLLSEREWIEHILAHDEPKRRPIFCLTLTSDTLDVLEKRHCADIYNDIDKRGREALASLPGLHELANNGDRTGDKLYLPSIDVERLWLARFVDENPHQIDQTLLRRYFSRSAASPTFELSSPRVLWAVPEATHNVG